MRAVHRIEVLTIIIFFLLSGMFTLLHSHGNADAADGSVRAEDPPQFHEPRPGTIFNQSEQVTFQWNSVATATHYIIQWTRNKDDVNGDGDYNNKNGEEQTAETQWSKQINNGDFGDGWWWFHVKAVLPGDETDWSGDLDIGADMDKPSVSINYPNPGDVLLTENITFGGDASDGFGLRGIEYCLDGDGNFMEGPNFPSKPTNKQWFIPVISLSSGHHSIEVKSKDLSEKTSDGSSVDFYIDVEYPTIEINTPSDGEVFYDSSNIYFEGNAEDDCEITELRYYFNDGEFGLNPGSWNMYIDLQPGENFIKVEAVDKAGRHSYNNITVFYETGLPNVNIENYNTEDVDENAMADMGKGIVLVDGSGAHGNLVGYVEDESGVRWIKYKINGEEPSDAAQIEITGGRLDSISDDRVDWRIPLSLEEQGIYMIEVTGADRVDRESRGNVIFILDEEDPRIESISPKPDEENRMIYEGETVPFSVRVMDNTGIGKVEYQVNGEGWSTLYELEPSQDQTGDDKPLTEQTIDWDHSVGWGVHTLEISVTDLVGRKDDYSYTVIVDNEEPSVTINQPQPDDIIDGNEVHVSVQANDNVELSHIAVYVVYRGAVEDDGSGDGEEGVSGNLQFEEDIQGTQVDWGKNLDLNNGKNVIYVQVTDITGRKSSAFVVIRVDAGNPTVFITGPDDGQYWNSQGITVVGNAYDDSGRIDRIEVRIFPGEGAEKISQEEGWNQANGNVDWTMDLQIAGAGENVIQARAFDKLDRASEIMEIRIHAGGDQIPGSDDTGSEGGGGKEDEGVTGGVDPAASGGGLLVIFVATIIILFVVLKKQKKSLAETEKELDEMEGLLRVKREEKEG